MTFQPKKEVEENQNQKKNPPEILSVGWFLPSSTAPIVKKEAAKRSPRRPHFKVSIFLLPQKKFLNGGSSVMQNPRRRRRRRWRRWGGAAKNKGKWSAIIRKSMFVRSQQKKVMVKKSQGKVVVRGFLAMGLHTVSPWRKGKETQIWKQRGMNGLALKTENGVSFFFFFLFTYYSLRLKNEEWRMKEEEEEEEQEFSGLVRFSLSEGLMTCQSQTTI